MNAADRATLLGRIAARVEATLGRDASAASKKKARGELARFLGVASGADAHKKRRRKIRQHSQRRNRR